MARILLIEDEAPLGRLYQLELEEEGHDVAIARGGDDAAREVARQVPDIMVVDINLEGSPNGLEVMSCLLANQPDIPVIINTAYSHYRSDFKSWAAAAYVVKSSDLGELKRAIAETLERHRKQ
jgi:two-component system response regulator (stage 0 sporulation protein F)